MSEFPFGIDPAGQVPNPGEPVTIVILPANYQMSLDHSFEPIPVLVANVKLICSPTVIPGSEISGAFQEAAGAITITGWDPKRRVLVVRLQDGALPITRRC